MWLKLKDISKTRVNTDNIAFYQSGDKYITFTTPRGDSYSLNYNAEDQKNMDIEWLDKKLEVNFRL